MTVFGNYSRYYDLLYQDKDYLAEAKFIHDLIQTHAPSAKTILELGCGTGRHAELLANYGYQIHGVDRSLEMLNSAKDRLTNIDHQVASLLKFSQGDVRTVDINHQFDVIISLFHVVSYQTTNQDLQATFNTIKKHLKSGGVCIFDVWYGLAVLTQKPTVRVKRLEDEAIAVTRIAEPVIYPHENLVDVNYQVFIKDKNTESFDMLQETHTMRYLFKPELEILLANSEMAIVDCKEWLTNQDAGFNTWGVYFIVNQ
ncbi:MAG: class I SAM-dependent DNA methyltransferase [Microcystis panniformis]